MTPAELAGTADLLRQCAGELEGFASISPLIIQRKYLSGLAEQARTAADRMSAEWLAR